MSNTNESILTGNINFDLPTVTPQENKIRRDPNAMDKRIFVRLSHNEVYADQARELCDRLADHYLGLFNQAATGGVYPAAYLNRADCMRECQYLCEYFKIRSFELRGNPSLTW